VPSAIRRLPGSTLPEAPAPGVVAVAVLVALLFGIALPGHPIAALALVALVPLAFAAPVASLGVLLIATVVVPFETQDRLAFVGGVDRPGLLLADLLVALGLCHIALLIRSGRLAVERPLLVALGVGVVLFAVLAEGLLLGADLSEAGQEARRLGMGVAGFILAWPILKDREQRRRLYGWLLALGLILGLWGLAQWFFDVGFTAGADIGVRPGVDLTSSSRGSLQGGLYAFPVAVTMAFAALVSRRVRSAEVRGVLVAIVLLNGMCLLLTYERSFWVATVVGCALAAVRLGPEARRTGLAWGLAGLLALILALGAIGELQTAGQRLASVSEYGVDNSLEYRQVESRNVVDAIQERPLLGSGLGATITWGKQNVFATQTTPFSHVGYLWLAWKMGVPIAIGLIALLAVAVLRSPRAEDEDLRVLRAGSQAALLALLLIAVTFPPFNAFGITAVMGVLTAACFVTRRRAT
jgi:O-Antigen ligase